MSLYEVSIVSIPRISLEILLHFINNVLFKLNNEAFTRRT